jgi:hypothetical protein
LADFLVVYGAVIVTAIGLVLFLSVRKHPKAYRFTLGLWIFGCIAGVFSPAIQTVSWHLRHGNHVWFEEEIVPVPLRWIVSRVNRQGANSKGIDIVKLPSNLISSLFWHEPDGLISLKSNAFKAEANPEETLKSWQSIYWTALTGGGRVISGPSRFKSGSQDIACMEMSDNSNPQRASASCLFLESGWTADFWGSQKDLDTFFDVVRNLIPV